MKNKKAMIAVLAILLLGISFFFTNRYLYEQKQLRQEEQRQQLIKEAEIAEIQDKIFAAISQFHPDSPKNNIIIATVNGWPITEEEIFYRKKMRESYGSQSDANFIFNMILEEKVCLAQTQAYGILPSMSEVNEEIESRKQEAQANIEFNDITKKLISDWNINEDIYWNIWEPYNVYRKQAGNNLGNRVNEDWWSDAQTGINKIDYYYIRVLEFKQNAEVKILEERSPYDAILDRLFSPSGAPSAGFTIEEVIKRSN